MSLILPLKKAWQEPWVVTEGNPFIIYACLVPCHPAKLISREVCVSQNPQCDGVLGPDFKTGGNIPTNSSGPNKILIMTEKRGNVEGTAALFRVSFSHTLHDPFSQFKNGMKGELFLHSFFQLGGLASSVQSHLPPFLTDALSIGTLWYPKVMFWVPFGWMHGSIADMTMF